MKNTADYHRLQIIKTLQRIFKHFWPFSPPPCPLLQKTRKEKKEKDRKRHFEGTLARKSILCHQDVLLIELFSLLKLSFLRIIRWLKFGPPLTRLWNKTWMYQAKQSYIMDQVLQNGTALLMLPIHYSLPRGSRVQGLHDNNTSRPNSELWK